MAKAYVKKVGGSPAVVVNDEVFPPMAMTTRFKKPDYIKSLGEAGIRIFYIMANTDWLRPGTKEEPSGFSRVVEDAAILLSQVPDAYIIIRIGLHPPVSWMEEHPEELMRYEDGSYQRAILMSEVHSDEIPGMYSFHSDLWKQDAGKALMDFCTQVENSDFADRVIGYFLAAGGTSEWYPVNSLIDYDKNICADYSEPFRKEFSCFLKNKYQTTEALKKAWNREDASFENPLIPSFEDRYHIRSDEAILEAMLNYENHDRMIGKVIELNPEHGANCGTFLNVDYFQHVADFYDAFHEGVANSIVYFAGLLRTRYDDKLVGSFYGSYGCTDFYNSGTATGVLAILNSGKLDFLAAPGVYNNREPGGYVAQREMQDSFRLRGQLYVAEEDSRTHLENRFYRDAMGLYDIRDSLNTLKRDFARNLCEDTYAWWFDQHDSGGRYEHEDIYALFKRQNEVAGLACHLPDKKKNDIAIIYDQESVHILSQYQNDYILDYYRSTDLGRIGAPIDYYFHNDMEREDMPDYKLYIMLNLFSLGETERDTIQKKAAKNHAVVLWLYAAGLVNPDRDKKMCPSHMGELTGFHTEMVTETVSPRFSLEYPLHPAVSLGKRDKRYGWIDKDLHSNVWLGSVLNAPFCNPGFYIEEGEGEVLGRFCESGSISYALKEYEGFTSVYCAAQIVSADLLASLAAYAGCHLFVKNEDYICANEYFVMIHACGEGERNLSFKKSCCPYEVYEQKYYGQNVTSIVLNMRHGDTLMFYVGEKGTITWKK